MNRISTITIACVFTVVMCISMGCAYRTSARISTDPVLTSQKEFSSLCSVLAELAIQRYEEDAINGKITILTVQTNYFEFTKYAEGDFELL